jgi:hypothetical protein
LAAEYSNTRELTQFSWLTKNTMNTRSEERTWGTHNHKDTNDITKPTKYQGITFLHAPLIISSATQFCPKPPTRLPYSVELASRMALLSGQALWPLLRWQVRPCNILDGSAKANNGLSCWWLTQGVMFSHTLLVYRYSNRFINRMTLIFVGEEHLYLHARAH